MKKNNYNNKKCIPKTSQSEAERGNQLVLFQFSSSHLNNLKVLQRVKVNVIVN